jgi:DNA-binding LacI/PurR family transcriptional regulator
MPNPTQLDVARRAGVSRGLVSLALSGSGRVSKETAARILAAAEELGYVRDMGAASLAARSSPLIGVLFSELRNPFQEDVIEAVEARALANSRLALLATGGHHREREQLVMRRFRELRVAGVILLSPAMARKTLQEYAEHLPLTVVSLAELGGMVDSVHVDERAAGVLVAERAAESGASRLVHLAASVFGGQDPTVTPRRKAVERAAKAVGLEFAIARSVPEAVATAGPDRRTAVSTHHDLIAVELVAALRQAGLAPGRDVPVIGYDDTTLAALPDFGLTSINQQAETLGGMAVDLLHGRIANPDRPGTDVAVAPTLTVRSSA